jgi:hypothetical protein
MHDQLVYYELVYVCSILIRGSHLLCHQLQARARDLPIQDVSQIYLFL